ncbi:hypothetical protein Fleli_0209 [Bernardetia litoralis DSM 6794]|uniref:Gliding motility-associated protein GldM first immunoglobulin-like domain-containing protein n=1 Tax=Bernardetia litoralis (strain ATCC 23117 / DSM 6794 / NBRC 15988 / NCIMB 1366 / Fx l1 / Sio-4) TaxID=880071 RepID=I4AFH0_BERLS|nr:hypothetical protein [Bernardetia litoralis]AFM02705.1 hypothetical protein Fleli_0209 [Bernardetia litoralis DSM 6794]
MKRILFPLLVLLFVLGIYAYMGTDIYDFSNKDLKVIHDADRIAVQLVAEKRVKNNAFIEKFRNYLDENGKAGIAVNTLQRIKQVQTLSSDLLQQSNEIRAQWLQNPDDKPTELLITFGESQEEYISKLRSFTEISLSNSEILNPLFTDPTKNNILSKSENDLEKTFVQQNEFDVEEFVAYFDNLPVAVRLYALTSIDAAIANREAEAIYFLSQKIEYPIFEIDNLVSVVTPTEVVLSEGDMYQAKMKVVGVSSFTKPQLEVENPAIYQDLKTNEKNGIATISFVAQADDYDERGLAFKTWTAKVKIQLLNGKDSTFVLQENYIVRKNRNGNPTTTTEINPNESNIIYDEPTSIE